MLVAGPSRKDRLLDFSGGSLDVSDVPFCIFLWGMFCVYEVFLWN